MKKSTPKSHKALAGQTPSINGPHRVALELMAHVFLAMKHGPLTIPLTAVSRNGRALCALFERAQSRPCHKRSGKPVLIITF
jgi:hypothetical protein